MICASEVGTINIDSSLIIAKGRLQPGKMLLVDTLEGRIVDDSELKMKLASRFPFRKWLDEQLITMENVRRNFFVKNSGFIGHFLDPSSLQEDKRMLVFGFNYEELHMIVTPMVYFINLGSSRYRSYRIYGQRCTLGMSFSKTASNLRLFSTIIRSSN